MRILVVGAGIIGSVYAARLSHAGHDVSLVARGARRNTLDDNGVVLHSRGTQLRTHPRILGVDEVGVPVDMTVVAVRTPQLDDVLDLMAAQHSPTVAFLQHLGPHVDRVRRVVGAERTVIAFPGIGGLFRDDGSVEYVEVGAQPTTIDSTAQRSGVFKVAIDSTGMRTALEPDMSAWLATHEVLVACLGSGVLSRGGVSADLASDPAQLRLMVKAIREGFAALSASGTRITPTALRVLFTTMPTWFAAAYWRHALRGPVGSVAIAPHARVSRDDEFASICSDVLDRVSSPDGTPTMTALISPWANPQR